MKTMILIAELLTFFSLIVKFHHMKHRSLFEIFCNVATLCILNFILVIYF